MLIFTSLRAILENYSTLYQLEDSKRKHSINQRMIYYSICCIRYGVLIVLIGMSSTVLAIIIDIMFNK